MPGANSAGAYEESARALEAAFRAPGALDRMVTVPIGTVSGRAALHLRITEALVHGWDLAQATGHRFDVPDELAAQELEFSRGALEQLPPGRTPFGTPQPVAPDAPALVQLVALLGRPVAGSATGDAREASRAAGDQPEMARRRVDPSASAAVPNQL